MTEIVKLIQQLQALSDDDFEKASMAAAEWQANVDEWLANHCEPDFYDEDAEEDGLETFDTDEEYWAAFDAADKAYLAEVSKEYGVDEEIIGLFVGAAQAENDIPGSVWPHLNDRNLQWAVKV